MPVSYTHLDVYKRQVVLRPTVNGSHRHYRRLQRQRLAAHDSLQRLSLIHISEPRPKEAVCRDSSESNQNSFRNQLALRAVISLAPRLHHHPLAHRVQNQIRRTMQFQLLQNVLAVRFHRVHAEEEPRGHLLIAVAFRDQLQHLALSRCQQLEPVFPARALQPRHVILLQQSLYLRTEVRLSRHHRADRGDQFVLRLSLIHI